ncbi:MAG: helix-hairpin-helix domain-containing protein [Bacteroidales bacterium]|nr:MAG: helix-hairpin-helix domain-containing protein [Bacteroidales bacterium]
MTELRKIPNVGPRTEADLLAMGYTTIESLRGKTAEDLYAEECRLRGCRIDRCQLYLYRAVVYFVNTENPDPAKSRWWLWKDEFAEPSACGARCVDCDRFPAMCGGCRKIRGKVFWLAYTGRVYARYTDVVRSAADGTVAVVPSCLAIGLSRIRPYRMGRMPRI